MKAAVLLRAIPDPESPPGEKRPLLLDAPSLVALSQALDWRRSAAGTLTGLALGPASWEAALREALALGLDEIERVAPFDDREPDLHWVAAALARALPDGTRLIFAGSAASDGGSGALPAALAGILDWPLLSDVTGVKQEVDGLQVDVRLGAARQRTYSVAAPAVLAAARVQPPSLYPPLARRFAASRASIEVIECAPAEEPRTELLGYGAARPRTKHLLRPDTRAKAGDRLSQLMSGGAQQRSGSKIGGEVADLARRLADILERAGLFSGV